MGRVRLLHYAENKNKNILYIMNKSFRIRNNYSLYEALNRKEKHGGNLIVFIMKPLETSKRNQQFFANHTKDLEEKLSLLSDQVKRLDWQDLWVQELSQYRGIVLDKAYLREDFSQVHKIVEVAKNQGISVLEVDSNVFQPALDVTDKEEYSAKTIRDKIWRLMLQPLVLMKEETHIGEQAAFDLLNQFIEEKLIHYEDANDPSKDYRSGLSPYLKYGFISPNVIYDIVVKTKKPGYESFLEELIVRRELAYNFVLFNKNYDKFDGMTYPWAYQTMQMHLHDPRAYLYEKEDYIHFKTHDPYFNAAMKEMVLFGRMHSYMRMYWAKKIIEWSPSYEFAYNLAIELNNEYFLDGNTPNGYTGVAWCFGKHDRAWIERPIFGKLRYMNDNGLKRKFDIEMYVKQINEEEKSINKK
ncbi:MAG: deoxyribodipyrimidine photo-lyase [Bacilli bacterium]|nr:deoxyribodipyrimidine photo-lyase [Bacilli bacterium]MBN2877206.1 deoxyribodipyrimidine photo-lyase [Bacilli bacterium]